MTEMEHPANTAEPNQQC